MRLKNYSTPVLWSEPISSFSNCSNVMVRTFFASVFTDTFSLIRRSLFLNKFSRTRSMFRFTIRDVLWLTVVVAVALGWWTSFWWQVAEKKEFQQRWYVLNQAVWAAGLELNEDDGDSIAAPGKLVPRKEAPPTAP
jgi:hypothetical protein